MSRVGKKPVAIPSGVQVEVTGAELTVKGKSSQLTLALNPNVTVAKEGDAVVVKPRSDTKEARAAWGLVRKLIANMIEGVSTGFKINLEINGVGYRAAVEGNILVLYLGYSHPIMYACPQGVEIKCPKPTSIEISGADAKKVGEIAAQIRAFRPPEPYKGKGVKYESETIIRKEGKKK